MKAIISTILLTLSCLISVQAASFDCKKAQSAVERLICGDPGISELDDVLGSLYRGVIKSNPATEEIVRRDQKEWLRLRDGCGDAACVRRRYHTRLLALSESIPMNASGAPSGADFGGAWSIDLRSPAERKRGAECGGAYFSLRQSGSAIIGAHAFATVDCGRINEGGDGTVKGVVHGAGAILVVTSGRNGAVVIGKATRRGGLMHWVSVDEIRAAKYEGDSALILSEGTLAREKPKAE